MFVIELTYKAPLPDIDASMRSHMKSVILAVGDSREQIETIAREDPFYARGLADFRVIEFRASQRAEDVPARIERSQLVEPCPTPMICAGVSSLRI